MSAAWVALAVAAGGAGAVVRFAIDTGVRRRMSASFPWAILAINVSGALALGVLVGLVLFRGAPGELTLVLGTGFCGGYTTFSTASFETVRLAQRGLWAQAVANGVGTALLTTAAAGLGLVLAR